MQRCQHQLVQAPVVFQSTADVLHVLLWSAINSPVIQADREAIVNEMRTLI
jgi:hypothetical protein